jgi:transposase
MSHAKKENSMSNTLPLPTKTRGRKTKLTPETQERICRALRVGMYRKTAIAACGIGEKTFYTWLARGDAEKSGPYRDFIEAVQLAEAEGEVALVGIIRAASKLHWQAAAWILERKHHDRWGRKDALAMTGTLEHTGEVKHHVTETIELTPELRRAAARLTAAYYRAERGGKIEPPEPEMLGDIHEQCQETTVT